MVFSLKRAFLPAALTLSVPNKHVSVFQSFMQWPTSHDHINPMTVDFSTLTSDVVFGRECAAITVQDPFPRKQVAQFLALGVVNSSFLSETVDNPCPNRKLLIHLPTLLLNRVQSCLSTAFRKWDTSLRSTISSKYMEFGFNGT